MWLRPFISIVCVLSLLACNRRNEELSTNPTDRLSFSEDTVFFDTLFSTVGSVTKRLIVYNQNTKKIRVSSIQLAGGDNSPYSIIVNGKNSSSVQNLEILGKDSIYILIKVMIDPSNQNLPFLVSDSLLFDTNTNRQKILLETYGQDAHFLTKETLVCNTTWVNDKPYVLYDTVNVALGCSLLIKKGCKIYGHRAAVLNVKGTLLVEGAQEDSVLFAGDKTDRSSAAIPGQWGGICFQSSSVNNRIEWATVRNATTAIRIDHSPDADTIAELSLSHVFLLHASQRLIDAGNTDINGTNVVLNNCPKALLKHVDGCGVWKHCTFANYSNQFFREEAALELGTAGTGLKVYFENSILWGDRINEASVYGNPTIHVSSCIWKSSNASTSFNTLNSPPQFTNSYSFDFSLKSTSPAINICSPVGVPDDVVGNVRDLQPDAGAYEF